MSKTQSFIGLGLIALIAVAGVVIYKFNSWSLLYAYICLDHKIFGRLDEVLIKYILNIFNTLH